MKARGEIYVVSREGELITRTNNLVVNTSKEIMRNLIAGANTAANVLSYIAVGTGTTPPTVNDTALENEVARVQIINYRFLGSDSVEFEAYFDQNTANGFTLTEAGLFTAGDTQNPNGLMFARGVIPGLTKDSTIAFYIKWRIIFV